MVVGLREMRTMLAEIACRLCGTLDAGCQEHLDFRPFRADPSCEAEAIELALDIQVDEGDPGRGTGLDQPPGFCGAAGFRDSIAAVPEIGGDGHACERVCFD